MEKTSGILYKIVYLIDTNTTVLDCRVGHLIFYTICLMIP